MSTNEPGEQTVGDCSAQGCSIEHGPNEIRKRESMFADSNLSTNKQNIIIINKQILNY